ncbi:MAG: hypothetical protein K1000chlam3_00384 [Chlamydiae bacterium]|nr:hypothetical protein [Chlamydiota bacterium]
MRKVLFIILFLGTVVFFLPQIASFGFAKRQVEAHLAKQLGGEVKIEKLSLSWFSIQTCHKVQWIDPSNGITLFADQVAVLASLSDCLRFKEKPLNVQVTGAEMKSQAKFRFIKKKKKKDLELHFSPIVAKIENGTIAFQQMQIEINTSMKVTVRGQFDLKKHHMDITLGLPPQTLKKVFKEAKNLPDDFLLEIPISTKLNSKAFEKALIGFFLKNYATVTSLHK